MKQKRDGDAIVGDVAHFIAYSVNTGTMALLLRPYLDGVPTFYISVFLFFCVLVIVIVLFLFFLSFFFL